MVKIKEGKSQGIFIQEILNEFAANIDSLIGGNSSIIQFGSSINGIDKKVMDIDLLILNNQISVFEDFEERLKLLKADLLDGKAQCGFDAANRQTVKRIKEYFSSLSDKNHTLDAVFKIGPLPMIETSENPYYYFHLKGPITEYEFEIFSLNFPFHSKSILLNHRIIKGSINKDKFLSLLTIDKYKIHDWNLALYKRIQQTSTKQQAIKCVKKLLLQYALFRDFNVQDEMLYESTLLSLGLNGLSLDPKQSHEEIQDCFSNIYQRIYNDLTTHN